MAQLLVRQIDESTKARLRQRARRNGRSLEAEAREILRAAARAEPAAGTGLGTRIAALFRGKGMAEGIPLLRGQPARPARFDR